MNLLLDRYENIYWSMQLGMQNTKKKGIFQKECIWWSSWKFFAKTPYYRVLARKFHDDDHTHILWGMQYSIVSCIPSTYLNCYFPLLSRSRFMFLIMFLWSPYFVPSYAKDVFEKRINRLIIVLLEQPYYLIDLSSTFVT